MTRHPYQGIPDRQMWRLDPGLADPARFDPVGPMPFRIAPADRVAAFGSCFAQHLGRHLGAAGLALHVTEPGHPMLDDDLRRRWGYGLFTARTGNVYTPRQLHQLLRRAFDGWEPRARAWPLGDGGRVVDPFRPRVQPDGFVSEAELEADRQAHLAAVREAFETMDVLVFTLGLTETWEDAADGAVFPLAPGVHGGDWDPDTVRFRNLDADETADDLHAALAFVRARNPRARIVLTVSPVPLNATWEPRHAAVSTAWSKAVLRVAAERACRRFDACAYFPSFEVITAPHVRGRYWAADGREVLEEGVEHVMRLFLRHLAGIDAPAAIPAAIPAATPAAPDPRRALAERVAEALCDEASITNR